MTTLAVAGTATANPSLVGASHVLISSGTGSSTDPMMIATSAVPQEMAASAFGQVFGKTAKLVTILGSRDLGWTSTSVFGDACQYLDTSQALMNTPTSGQTLYIVSTSANDTNSAGTGVRSVRIIYLDANGSQQVKSANLNGTTPVSLGTGHSFIQWMESASVGSGGVSAGDISITSTNGAATVATTFERIATGGGRSLSGRYRVPAGYTAYMAEWTASAISNTMDVRIRSDVFSDDRTLVSGCFHFMDRAFLAQNTEGHWYQYWDKYPEGATIKISAIPGAAAAGNKIDCDFSMIIVSNS